MRQHLTMTAGASLGVAVATLASGIVIARALGPDARGTFGVAVLLAQLTVGLATLSIFEAAVIKLRSSRDEAKSVARALLCVAIGVLVIAMIVVFGAWSAALLPHALTSSPAAIAIICGLVAVGVITAAFEALEAIDARFDHLNAARLAGPALFAVALLVLAAMDALSLNIALAALLVTLLPALAIRLYRWRRTLRIRRSGGPTFSALALLGVRLHAAHGTMLLARHADRVILAGLWPVAALGHYFVAFSVVTVGLALLCQALQIAATPAFASASLDALRASLPGSL
ncbi:MAG: oligosaccharide flippase family protein, partial [Pseudomonadota bacterium]